MSDGRRLDRPIPDEIVAWINGFGEKVLGRNPYIRISLAISPLTSIMIPNRTRGELAVNEEDERNERTRGRRRLWMRHWMRHTAVVPKGFLRYRLLKMLSEKPMSGSEIMGEIEQQTNGYWKPSPGSIYPLLSWLQDQGYVQKVAQKEPGIRRFTLTEKGRGFLEEEAKTRRELNRRLEHLTPAMGFIGPMRFGFRSENNKELRKAIRGLAIEVKGLFHELRNEYSKDAAEQTVAALQEATRKIHEIASSLEEQRKS